MDAKKIAVLVRDRQSEALRMALGLTLVDDLVDVYVIGHKLEEQEQDLVNLELMKDMGMHIYSDCADEACAEYCSIDQIAQRVPEYDHILPY